MDLESLDEPSAHLQGRVLVGVADITLLKVEVVVNAANSALCGGGGVDGAIHRAAGPELLEECLQIGGADTGTVVLTAGYAMSCRFIAHAVGPVWYGGDRGEADDLAACYRRGLELAVENECSTIAFPSISTGAYRFPIQQAASVAANAIAAFVSANSEPGKTVMCCFSSSDAAQYRRAFDVLDNR